MIDVQKMSEYYSDVNPDTTIVLSVIRLCRNGNYYVRVDLVKDGSHKTIHWTSTCASDSVQNKLEEAFVYAIEVLKNLQFLDHKVAITIERIM